MTEQERIEELQSERDAAISERDETKRLYNEQFGTDGEDERRKEEEKQVGDYFKSLI